MLLRSLQFPKHQVHHCFRGEAERQELQMVQGLIVCGQTWKKYCEWDAESGSYDQTVLVSAAEHLAGCLTA